MASIKAILAKENPEQGIIRLYREGIFYKAYEYSAYLFTMMFHSYKLRRRFYKVVGCDVVSTGFPMSVLNKIVLPDGVEIEDAEGENEDKVIITNVPVDPYVFPLWKSEVPLWEKDAATIDNDVAFVPLVKCEQEVINKILDFNFENTTPMQCMLLLSELRKKLRDNDKCTAQENTRNTGLTHSSSQ